MIDELPFFFKIFLPLFLLSAWHPVYGQIEESKIGSIRTLKMIPAEIRDHLNAIFEDKKSVASIIPLIEEYQDSEPDISLYIIEELFLHQIDRPVKEEWVKLRYYNALLRLPSLLENENLELLHSDLKLAVKYYKQKGDWLWLAKSYGLLSNIEYNIAWNSKNKSFEEAIFFNRRGIEVLESGDFTMQEANPVLGELYRVKANICLEDETCPIDSALVTYDKALKYYISVEDKVGQAIVLLNKAIGFADLENETDSFGFLSSPVLYYEEAIELLLSIERNKELGLAQLEYAIYLGDKYIETRDTIWLKKSNQQLNRIIANNNVEKCGAHFQLAVNLQNYLSYSVDLDEEEQLILLDSLAFKYQKALNISKVENNLRSYQLLSDKIAHICPFFSPERCTELLILTNEIKFHFLRNNRSNNELIREKSIAFTEEIETQRRKTQILGIAILGMFLFAVFFVYFQRRHIRNLKRNLEAKLEALRAQMNPHFISNSMNAIESLINQGRNDEASEYLIDFSRLCRSILDNSKYPTISLEKELESLKYFLSLEQLRLGDNLDYIISIDENLNLSGVMVPSMMIQPFVENAIWHGIMNKAEPKGGVLRITIKFISPNNLECCIEDNGVGRKEANRIKNESVIGQESWGMTITQQRIDHLNARQGASLQIEDLYDSNKQAKGTKVVIRLPIEKQ